MNDRLINHMSLGQAILATRTDAVCEAFSAETDDITRYGDICPKGTTPEEALERFREAFDHFKEEVSDEGLDKLGSEYVVTVSRARDWEAWDEDGNEAPVRWLEYRVASLYDRQELKAYAEALREGKQPPLVETYSFLGITKEALGAEVIVTDRRISNAEAIETIWWDELAAFGLSLKEQYQYAENLAESIARSEEEESIPIDEALELMGLDRPEHSEAWLTATKEANRELVEWGTKEHEKNLEALINALAERDPEFECHTTNRTTVETENLSQ